MGRNVYLRYGHLMEPGADPYGPLQDFRRVVAGDAGVVRLDLAALAIAAALHPDVDAAGTLATLDALAVGIDDLDDLRRSLYGGHGFSGSCPPVDDPSLSLLHLVLARRTGLPILLGAVVIEVGRRAGVPVVGVNLPLHFFLADGRRPDVYIDPCTGDTMDAAGVRAFLDRFARGRVPWTDRHLRPVPSRHIVIRMLTNLQAVYQRRQDPVRLAVVGSLRATIPELAQEQPAATRLGAVFN